MARLANRHGGTPIAYRNLDPTAGTSILLVHGGLFDPMDGEKFWIRPGIAADLVAANHHVIIPDRRFGSGGTSAPFAIHTWDIEASDLLTVLDDVGDAHVDVVAGSNGCSAAIRLALTAPERIRSLVLCWPVAPEQGLHDAFERSAAAIARGGTAAYLATLRAQGLPRPDEPRPGFPYGVALLQNDAIADQFLRNPAADAAEIVRGTAAALLPGDILRGVTRADATRLAQLGFPVAVVPTVPEDRSHTAQVATDLATAIRGATVLPGSPPSPAPAFIQARATFSASLHAWFAGD